MHMTAPALPHPQYALFDSEDSAAKSAAAQPQTPPTSKFSDYIVYVDESGDHGMQTIDANYPVFVLAFCVFHKRHYSEKVVPAL